MKYIVLLLGMISCGSAFASEGFTWLHGIAHSLHIPEHTVTFIFAGILFLIIGLIYKAKSRSIENSLVPRPGVTFGNIFETIGEFIYTLTKNTIGEKDARLYFPLLIFFFMFIFLNNLLGLVPGFLPATENMNTALALGIFSFLYYNGQGIRVQGIVNHLKHLAGPVLLMAPLIFIIELISHVMRPVVLGLRLQGNMMGDHTVLAIFSDLVPYIVPIPFYCLGIFVCFMQAFVFTFLSMLYISMAVETHDHEDHAH